ncbi:GntR family transcriptional regulator [Petrocella sp. FN5]|uniref:GntR family transcriptional regulator n=1 Tax=Petrocella sp. FN5 TaxID=3032002 RepID=UPI0023D9EAC8|nr:GntR family transcriptional regulator [Petrocella sp. FN5]MDF1616846.1 GntR family transcriptional regulator [Petrocella sp. FN5]
MVLKLIERNKYDSVREYVYNTLRENIMNLDLKPGTNITEKDIAEMMEVSRTPVREALLKLSQEDLLNIYPQKGTIVSLLDINYIEQAMFIRMSLEVAIVKLACQKFSEEILYELRKNLNDMAFQIKQLDINTKRLFSYDTEFHKLLYKGTGMMQAWFVITQVSTHLNRARYLKLLTSDIHWEGIIKQHTELVDALENRETEKAIKVLNAHLGGFDMEIYRLKENHQDLFV